MSGFKDIAKQRYGKLVAISLDKIIVVSGKRRTYWNCLCDCGNKVSVLRDTLISGKANSCGCIRQKRFSIGSKRHGLSESRLYKIYHGMMKRCYTPSTKCYKNYGGRGITVCNDWLENNGFMKFYNWSMMNGYNEKLTLDRSDNDKPYSPDNCRWSSVKQQNRNRRSNHNLTFKGETKPLCEWSDMLGIKYKVLQSRVNYYGWSAEEALTIPVGGRRK